MVQQIKNIKKRLLNKKGESLMEAIVSIAIFSIMSAAVGSMLLLAMRITATSIINSNAMQDNANAVIASTTPDAADGADGAAPQVTFIFTQGADGGTDDDSGTPPPPASTINITVPVDIHSNDDFMQFRPN